MSVTIIRSTATTPGDNLGGIATYVPYLGAYPWIDSDTLNNIYVEKAQTIKSFSIQGNTTGEYRFITANGTGSYTAISDHSWGEIADPNGYIARIYRDGDAVAGTLTAHNIYDEIFPEADIADSKYYYRCVFIYCSVADTLDAIVSSGCDMWLDVVGNSTYLGDGETEPTGASWGASLTPAQALTPGQTIPLWIRSSNPGTAGFQLNSVVVTCSSSTYAFLVGLRGITDTASETYTLYNGASTDSVAQAAVDTFTTWPYTYTISSPLNEKVCVTYKNKYGMESIVRLLTNRVWTDAGGNDLNVPHAPDSITATDTDDGYFRIESVWTPSESWPRITEWAISWNGDTHDDSATVVANARGLDGTCDLSYLAGPFDWGENVVFTVSVKYGTTTGTSISTASVQCAGHAVQSVDALGQRAFNVAYSAFNSDSASFGNVLVEYLPGYASFSIAGVPIISCLANGLDVATHTLYDLQNATITGTSGDPVSVDGTDVYLNAGGNKVLYMDTANKIIYGASFEPLASADMCPAEGLYFETADATYWQIFDLTTNSWRTWLKLKSTGEIYLGYDWKQL